MCHRFNQKIDGKQVTAFSQTASDRALAVLAEDRDRYPLYDVAVIRPNDQGQNELVSMQWGFVPSWLNPEKQTPKQYVRKYSTFNARCETAHEKPSYRSAFKTRRCLIPAARFFEPQGKAGNWFEVDSPFFYFAGLWESWSRDDQAVESCTLLTTDANELVESHRSGRMRMPVLVTADEDCRLWLNPDHAEPNALSRIFAPYCSQRMRCFPDN